MIRVKNNWRNLWILLYSLAVVGCAPFPARDSTRYGSIDVSKIPDAVPHHVTRSKHGNPSSYVVFGKRYYVLPECHGYEKKGIASWYGSKFHGRLTSSGEIYNMNAMTAASKTLPLPCYVRVTNLTNGASVIVKVNDRGPFVENRIIDLSYAAAAKLGMLQTGTALVDVQAVGPNTNTLAKAPRPSPPPTRSIIASPRIYLQIGAFAQRTNATRVETRLRSAHLKPVFVLPEHSRGRLLFKVRIGPIPDVASVDRISDRVNKLGLGDPEVVIQ